jgi:hypothetical protein
MGSEDEIKTFGWPRAFFPDRDAIHGPGFIGSGHPLLVIGDQFGGGTTRSAVCFVPGSCHLATEIVWQDNLQLFPRTRRLRQEFH